MRTPEQLGDRVSLTVSASRVGRADLAVASTLGVALVYGVLDQGGFYPERFANLLGLVLLATLLRLLTGPRRVPPYLVGCAAAWLGFAGWALFGAGADSAPGAGWPSAVVAAWLAAAAWSAGGLSGPGRRLLATVVLAVGLVAAAAGWIGVALHRPPLALPSSGLWRAASTLTYANATAALLVVAILVALAVLPESRRLLSWLVLAGLLLGLGATMSRAGALALVVGLLVAAGSPTLRRRLAGNWPALPAAAAGFAGLLPALPEAAGVNPLPAVAGLLGGIVLLLLADRRPRLTAPAICAGLALTLLLAPAATLSTLGDTRLTTASPERADLVRVAYDQFTTAPITGVGPGRLDLAYLDHTGVPVLARFVHQEYLQLAAETGLVGLGLVVAGAVALAVGALTAGARTTTAPRRCDRPTAPRQRDRPTALRRCNRPTALRQRDRPTALRRCNRLTASHWRDRPTAPEPVAALAVLAGFATHSAFDFLWHIPVLPLLAVLALAALIPHPNPFSSDQEQEIS